MVVRLISFKQGPISLHRNECNSIRRCAFSICKKLTVVLLGMCVALFFGTLYVHSGYEHNRLAVPNRQNYLPHIQQRQQHPSNTIKIGIVTCLGTNKTANFTNLEVVALIKSVVVSAKMYVVRRIELHIFIDANILEKYIKLEIKKYNFQMRGIVVLKAYFYSVFKSVPEKYLKDFVLTDLPCTYVRLFFPDILTQIDEILYLDTDTVVLGNITQIWSISRDERLGHMASMVLNNVPQDINFPDVDAGNFQDLPVVPPKGVNAGFMYMNLTSMRAFNWTKEVVDVYKKFQPEPERNQNHTTLNDQQIINVIFHFNLEKLTLMPCTYNFQHLHCLRGLSCAKVLYDPIGIQILHGAGGAFQQSNSSHSYIYNAFKNFNLFNHGHVVESLLTPVKIFYANIKNSSTCFGLLGSSIFKNSVIMS